MAAYEVSRTVETVATGRASTTNTAKTESASKVAEAIATAGGEELVDVDTEALDVYEFPSAPFEPYRVTVEATVTVHVEGDGECDAIDRGGEVIEGILAASDLDGWEYVGSTELEAPV